MHDSNLLRIVQLFNNYPTTFIRGASKVCIIIHGQNHKIKCQILFTCTVSEIYIKRHKESFIDYCEMIIMVDT